MPTNVKLLCLSIHPIAKKSDLDFFTLQWKRKTDLSHQEPKKKKNWIVETSTRNVNTAKIILGIITVL